MIFQILFHKKQNAPCEKTYRERFALLNLSRSAYFTMFANATFIPFF